MPAQNENKKPRFFGLIATSPNHYIPTMLYDAQKLPLAFAFFSTKKKCDDFLIKHSPQFPSASKALGNDMKVMNFQGFILQVVGNFLRAVGKELDVEQLAQLVFYKMGVVVDPKFPQMIDLGAEKNPEIYQCFKEFMSVHFAQAQLFELLDMCELVDLEVKDDHTIIRGETKAKEKEYLCFTTPGYLTAKEDLASEIEKGDVTKRIFYVTGFYPNKMMAYDDAVAWISAQNAEPPADAPSGQAT